MTTKPEPSAPSASAPPSAKGQRRLETILDAAITVLIEEGYAGFTLRRIASQAGLRLSHVQYYFAGKDALLQAILQREFERSAAVLQDLTLDQNCAPRERMSRMLDHLLDDQTQRASCAIFWELWAISAREPAVAAIMDGYYDRFIAAAAELIGQIAPSLPPQAARRRAALTISMLEGASLLRGYNKPARAELGDFTLDLRKACLDLAAADPDSPA